jgi:hypothetical protein
VIATSNNCINIIPNFPMPQQQDQSTPMPDSFDMRRSGLGGFRFQSQHDCLEFDAAILLKRQDVHQKVSSYLRKSAIMIHQI